MNALQLTILFGHTVAIDYLFNIYKEPGSLYIMGSYTVLYLAVLANRPDSLKCLLEHPSIKARKHFGEKPDIHQEIAFHLAKRLDYVECADILQHNALQTTSYSSLSFFPASTPVHSSSLCTKTYPGLW